MPVLGYDNMPGACLTAVLAEQTLLSHHDCLKPGWLAAVSLTVGHHLEVYMPQLLHHHQLPSVVHDQVHLWKMAWTGW